MLQFSQNSGPLASDLSVLNGLDPEVQSQALSALEQQASMVLVDQINQRHIATILNSQQSKDQSVKEESARSQSRVDSAVAQERYHQDQMEQRHNARWQTFLQVALAAFFVFVIAFGVTFFMLSGAQAQLDAQNKVNKQQAAQLSQYTYPISAISSQHTEKYLGVVPSGHVYVFIASRIDVTISYIDGNGKTQTQRLHPSNPVDYAFGPGTKILALSLIGPVAGGDLKYKSSNEEATIVRSARVKSNGLWFTVNI